MTVRWLLIEGVSGEPKPTWYNDSPGLANPTKDPDAE